MGNSKILKIIGGVLAVIGAVIGLIGNGKRAEAVEMISALKAGGEIWGYDSSTRKSIEIWQEHLSNGKLIMYIGIAVLIIGLILLFIGILKRNAIVNPENQHVINTPIVAPSEDATDKLKKLNELKTEGLISEDEYVEKRKKVIDDI